MTRRSILPLAAVFTLVLAASADARPCLKVGRRCASLAPLQKPVPRARFMALLGEKPPLPKARSRSARKASASMGTARRRLLARARIASSPPAFTSEITPTPEGQLGRGGSGTATQRRTVNGLQVDTTMGFGDDRFADACPAVGGLLHGKVRTHYSISSTAPLPRRLNVTQGFDFEAKATLTGHVGADGKLRDYDLAAEVEIWVRVTVRGPTGLVHGEPFQVRHHTRVVFVGLKRGGVFKSWVNRDHIGSEHVLSLLEPAGASVGPNDGKVLGFAWSTLKDADDDVLGDAEKHYFDAAACLSARFTPDPVPPLRPTEPRGLAVAVTGKDGAPQSFDLDLTADNATLSAPRVHAAPSTPAAFTVRAADREGHATISAGGVSERGRLKGALGFEIADPVRAWGYVVRLTGTGAYSEDDDYADASTQRANHYRTAFTFDVTWPRVVLPVDGSAPRLPLATSTSTTVGGTAASTGTRNDKVNGDASYSCEASLAGVAGALPLTLDGAQGFTVRLPALMLTPGGACTTKGTGFAGVIPAIGGLGVADLGAALAGTGALHPGRASFEVTITPAALAEPCTLARSCSHALTITATATFTRIERCDPAGPGYACRTE